MAAPGIAFEGVWKKFRRGERHDSLRDLLPALARRLFRRARRDDLEAEEFWAVRDVSFVVKPGEALGIVGPNGAGKSTVLKLLTRILKPTRGRVEVRGRFGALIEIAAGFHPDLTGRENVYLQGAIMGMKRAEIARKFDAIVDFAGVREFIDTPVKRYSSGMHARLGFAVAAHLDPEVLIIDEVLSVGDTQFQAKCAAHMRGLIERGVPVVFVSHNLQAIQELCTRAIVLDRGRVLSAGEPAQAIQEYRKFLWARQEKTLGASDGRAEMRIAGVEILGESGEPAEWFETGSSMTVRIRYRATRPIERPHFGVEIHRADGTLCYGVNTSMDHRDLGTIEGEGCMDLHIPRLWLLPGAFSLSVAVWQVDGLSDTHERAYPFSVASKRRDFGVVFLEHEWRLRCEPAARST